MRLHEIAIHSFCDVSSNICGFAPSANVKITNRAMFSLSLFINNIDYTVSFSELEVLVFSSPDVFAPVLIRHVRLPVSLSTLHSSFCFSLSAPTSTSCITMAARRKDTHQQPRQMVSAAHIDAIIRRIVEKTNSK